MTRVAQILDAEHDQIASAQLTIDRQIEQGQVARPVGQLQSYPDRPDVSLLERKLLATSLPLFQGEYAWCSMLSSDLIHRKYSMRF